MNGREKLSKAENNQYCSNPKKLHLLNANYHMDFKSYLATI